MPRKPVKDVPLKVLQNALNKVATAHGRLAAAKLLTDEKCTHVKNTTQPQRRRIVKLAKELLAQSPSVYSPPVHFACRSSSVPALSRIDQLRNLFGKTVKVASTGKRGKVVAIYDTESYAKARNSDVCVSLNHSGEEVYLKLNMILLIVTVPLYAFKNTDDQVKWFSEMPTAAFCKKNKLTRYQVGDKEIEE